MTCKETLEELHSMMDDWFNEKWVNTEELIIEMSHKVDRELGIY